MGDGAGGRRRESGRRGAGLRAAGRPGSRHHWRGLDGRIRLVRLLVLVVFVLIGSRAVALAASSDLSERAQQQQTRVVELPAHRGAILDRSGRELAVGTPQQTVYAAPSLLDDPIAATGDLCTALEIKRRKDKLALLEALSNKKSGFAYVARKADPDLAKAALALNLPGVGAYAEEARSYPGKGSAAQVIGYAGVDNHGLEGIEFKYDKELAGQAGSQLVVRDPAGRLIKTISRTEPVAGADVTLTLDSDLQVYAEDVLKRTVRQTSAKGGVAVVMDPRSGQILALVNVPIVKDHDFGRWHKNATNAAVSNVYEPGSIFKMVTVAGALADGLVTPQSKFTLQSSIRVADREINESHERGTVTYSVAEILQWSSNVGAVRIGQKMGEEGLYKWVKAFGFGQKSGVEFPNESAGIVPDVDAWSGSSIGNIPMGQGIAVTPLQMAAAVSTIANDGVAVTPKLVLRVGETRTSSSAGKRVIPVKVARQVRRMLTKAVDAGTGTKARIEGYKVAGKTGTSQKVVDGEYSRSLYVASFAGMAPAAAPRVVVLVAVDEPRGSIYGGDVAAPAVQQIMGFALQHLEIAP